MNSMRSMGLFFAATSLSLLLTSCPDGFGWPDSKDVPQQSNTKPAEGAKIDITAIYKNNCGVDLLVYYIEVPPGSTFSCSQLTYVGALPIEGTIAVTLHVGKIGYAVFAMSADGQCSGSEQKAYSWIDGSRATSSEGHFNVCNP